MLKMSIIATNRVENSGTVPDPPRSIHARVKRAYMNVAANAPSE